MGTSESILINEKENGIFEVNVKDYPEYPVVYIRLCFDKIQNRYCMVADCDIKDKYLKRKIIVVGMRLPGYDKINEQSFYLSSGLNAIKTLESFFKTEFGTEDCDSGKGCGIWIPFSGLGYESRRNPVENNIKLLKSYFNCSKRDSKCKYGRFGNTDPNLAQISYCLGGSFWDKNFDKIESIEKMPTLYNYLEKIPCTLDQSVFTNNTDCSVFVNCYISSAVVINYFSESQFAVARKTFLRYKSDDTIKNIIENIKFDWNIVYYSLIFPLTDESYMHIFKNYLPSEDNFSANSPYLFQYLSMVINVYKNSSEYFNEIILPFIKLQDYSNAINNKIETQNFLDNIEFTQDKKKIEFIVTKEKEDPEKKKREEDISIALSSLTLFSTVLGTIENPYSKRDDARVGDYYLRGSKPVQKRI